MVEKIKIKKDIVNWLENHKGVFDLVEDDDLIPAVVDIIDLTEMLVDFEEKYNAKSIANAPANIPQTDEETLGSLTNWFHNYFNNGDYDLREKQLFGIYYASREFARQHNDPLLDVVVAFSQEEAENIAKISVKDHGAGVHAVSLKYYEEGYNKSTEGSDLRTAYTVLSKQIKDMWLHKNKAR